MIAEWSCRIVSFPIFLCFAAPAGNQTSAYAEIDSPLLAGQIRLAHAVQVYSTSAVLRESASPRGAWVGGTAKRGERPIRKARDVTSFSVDSTRAEVRARLPR